MVFRPQLQAILTYLKYILFFSKIIIVLNGILALSDLMKGVLNFEKFFCWAFGQNPEPGFRTERF